MLSVEGDKVHTQTAHVSRRQRPGEAVMPTDSCWWNKKPADTPRLGAPQLSWETLHLLPGHAVRDGEP